MDSYCPTGGFYRRALFDAASNCDHRRVLRLGLDLALECEYLRTWARANGLTPPHFTATGEQANRIGAQLLPVPVAVNRSRIRAGGAELVPEAPQCRKRARIGA
jgi:hypothetical protein